MMSSGCSVKWWWTSRKWTRSPRPHTSSRRLFPPRETISHATVRCLASINHRLNSRVRHLFQQAWGNWMGLNTGQSNHESISSAGFKSLILGTAKKDCPLSAVSKKYSRLVVRNYFFIFIKLLFFGYTLLSQWEFLPWEIRVAFPKESQPNPT